MFEFVRYRTDDNDLNMVQDGIESFARSFDFIPILNGRLIENVKFTNETAVKVQHGLGRNYRGYIVVSMDKPAVIHRHAPDDKDRARFLPLRCSVMDATISIWVF